MKKKSTAAKPSQLAVILNALDDLKAQNVVAIDVTRLSDVMDTLVIASGSSNRQVRGLAQHAAEESKKNGMPAMGSEGMDDGEWALVDFGDLVLHVMQPEVREFYELEKLWLIPGHSEVIDTQTATSKTAARKKPAADKKPAASSKKETAAKKPGKTAPVKKTSARKKVSDDVMVSQSDASKARRRKTATAATARKKAPMKTAAAPAKAGTYAKTGTRKPAAAKPAPSKTTAAKKPAVAKAKSAAKKAAPSKPRAPRKG
ncbi:MAG: ribosome silencing factor [Pseudomonadales bacterium]